MTKPNTKKEYNGKKPTLEEAYKQWEKFIYYVCHNFKGKYNGDVDEYISQANTIFATKAYQAWNPDPETQKCSNETHFRSWIWMCLLDIYRPIWTKSTKYGAIVEPEVLENVAQKNLANFLDYEHLKHSLSKDAFTTLRLILNPPTELQTVIDGKGGTPRNYKSSVKQYLQSTMKWNRLRVIAAFEELGGELFGRPDSKTIHTTIIDAPSRGRSMADTGFSRKPASKVQAQI